MKNLEERGHLLTEQVNANSENLDQLNSLELVDLFNREDAQTLRAIAGAREHLAQTIDIASESLRHGGRLFYVGAGTSGRLGVLDAAECPPTFCTPPELVQGIIAGGAGALVRSSEDLEDRAQDGESAIAHRHITNLDVVIGITAGGTTPFVAGALQAARQRGAKTIFMACVPVEQVSCEADVDIRLLVGPEVVAGSTRLKAGNRMVDVAVTNKKLRDRAVRMLQDLTDLKREEAGFLLEKSGKSVKLALMMHWTGLEKEECDRILGEFQGNLRSAVASIGH